MAARLRLKHLRLITTLLLLGALTAPPAAVLAGDLEFVRGDADQNGIVFGLLDALYLLNYLVGDADEPDCFDATDVNDDGDVNVLDPIILLAYSFASGAPPADPFPDCGFDDTDDDDLDCTSSDCP